MCVDGENGLIQLTAQRPVYTPLIHRTDVGRAVKVTRIQATRSVCTSTMVDQWTHHSIKLNPWLGSFIQLITMITINTFTHSVSSSSSMDFCSRQRGSHVTQDWFDHFDDDRTALEMFLYILLPCQILVLINSDVSLYGHGKHHRNDGEHDHRWSLVSLTKNDDNSINENNSPEQSGNMMKRRCRVRHCHWYSWYVRVCFFVFISSNKRSFIVNHVYHTNENGLINHYSTGSIISDIATCRPSNASVVLELNSL
jgi:hypothetical protein